MSIETMKESIFSTATIEAQSLQIPLQEDVIVPDVKPDIERILQSDAKVMFDDMNIDGGRVKFSGKVDCNVLYLSEGPNKTVHNMSITFTIDEYINVDDVRGEALYHLDGFVENIRIEKLNSRKLNINCILDVGVVTEEKLAKSIITGAEGLEDLQIRKSPFETRQLVINKEEKFIVKDEMAVPTGKANINEVLWCDITLKNKEVKVLDDKVAVKGDLHVCILYSGENEEHQLEFIEKEVPFNGIVESYGSTQEMYTNTDIKISKYYLQVMPDLDGEDRVIEIEVVAEMNVKVYCIESKDIITDLYSPTKELLLATEPAKFQNMVFKNQMKANVSESIGLRDDLPDIMQVLYVNADSKVEDIEIMDNQVIAEGVIFTKVFYVGADDNNPLCSFDEIIPFRQVIEARDARDYHKVEIKAEVEHASCNMLSGREVELRCVMGFDTNVLDEHEMNLIVGIEESDKDMEFIEKLPSVVIYVVQPDDSLWDIAKRYNTSIGELMMINELESEAVSPGEKILVVKKLMEY